MSKIKNTLDGINSRLKTTEEKISEPKDTAVVIVQNEMGRGLLLGEGGWRTKPHDLWVYSKEIHLCEIRDQERRKKKLIKQWRHSMCSSICWQI